MGNRIEDIQLNARRERGVRATSKEGVNKVDEGGVNVAGALSGQGKKGVFWVCVVLRIIGMFFIASNLRSLRMRSFVGGARR